MIYKSLPLVGQETVTLLQDRLVCNYQALLIFRSKQEVFYQDIRHIQARRIPTTIASGKWILYVYGVRSALSTCTINIGLFKSEDQKSMIAELARLAPSALLNDEAVAIKEGRL